MLMKLLDRLEEVLIATLMATATIIIFVAVAHRYSLTGVAAAFNYGRAHDIGWLTDIGRFGFVWLRSINLTWAQELCIYLFVWMAKFGAAYGVRTGVHVGVDVLVNRLPAGPRHKIITFALMCGALFTAIVGTLGARFVWEMAGTDQVSADLEMPMWIVYLCVPLGSYLMCFRFLQVAWRFWRSGELPAHDPGHVEGLAEPAPASTVAAVTRS
jgi:C4-dicarboxylate transporter DctQ subunit